MLLRTKSDLDNCEFKRSIPVATKVLMVNPSEFEVVYAINPHMRDEQGNIHTVDRELARTQWMSLKQAYQKCQLEVFEIEGQKGLPDMVFCANTSFPYLDDAGNKHVLASRMHSDKRKDEVEHILKWYSENNYQIHHLKTQLDFEANGDALIHHKWILGGYGFRTSLETYNEVSDLTNLPVVALKLLSDKFYHLDTCLSIINENTIAVVKEGLAGESLDLLAALYKNIIYIDLDEAIGSFAANCHCPDGKNVFLHAKCPKFCAKLESLGLQIHPIDTSEYMKSGGSVFCMKMMAY